MTTATLKRAAALASLGSILGAQKSLRKGRLSKKLGSLHGLPQKVGQLLALGELDRADAFFAELTEGGEALKPVAARKALETALGQSLDGVFSSISFEAIAASLGQVHRARLRDGTDVAVKLQYPAMAEAVRIDLGALGLIGRAYRRGYDLRAYQQTLGEMIERELDYTLELKAMDAFAARADGDGQFVIPKPIRSLCGPQVLTMTWLDGRTLHEVKGMSRLIREEASRLIIRWFLRSVLEWGLVHGDAHPGNIRFQIDANGQVRLGLLDFGCVQSLEASMAGGLRLLIEAVASGQSGSPSQWLARYEAMGFDTELLSPIASELQALSQLLVAPLTVDTTFDPRAWDLNERIKLLLGDKRLSFRFASPSSFSFVTRAFVGLVQTLKALAAPVSWRPIYDEAIARSTRSALPEFMLASEPRPPRSAHVVLSKHLQIRVRRFDGTRVSLTFPARAAENLSGLVPPEISPRLHARGIDVQSIEKRVLFNQFAPGELFRLEEPERHVCVWLE